MTGDRGWGLPHEGLEQLSIPLGSLRRVKQGDGAKSI
jgi:hypothetical protein